MTMIEGRAIIKDIEETRQALIKLGAECVAEYQFKDIIFVPRTDTSLNDDYIRIRVYSKNNWPTKNVVVMRKKAKFHAVGKEDTIVLKKEFDSEDEARQYIEQEFNDSFIFGFEFSRVGWQYSMGEYRLFVEDIEKMPPVIEIEAGTEEALAQLYKNIGIIKELHDSIPELIKKYENIN